MSSVLIAYNNDCNTELHHFSSLAQMKRNKLVGITR